MQSTVLALAALADSGPDLAFVGAAVGFFALAVAFAWFCEKLR